jgi:RHH-type rel operon transcriptional repressor/antitoxin RelB
MTTTMTVTSARLPSTVKKRLDKLAAATARSRNFIILDALDAYLELNEWQVAAIKTSLADERPNISHSDVVARMKARSAKAAKK